MDLPRLVFLTTTLLITFLRESYCTCPSCETVHFNSNQNVMFNYAMEGRMIASEKHEVSSIFECFLRCQKNCLCVSFNVLDFLWPGGVYVCELNHVDGYGDPLAVKPKNGSLFYNLHRQVAPDCPDCSSRLSCCTSSQPCYNGRCIDSCNELGRRYLCKCHANFQGTRCEDYMINN